MSRRASVFTAAASYVQLGSTVATGLISFPMAQRFLSSEQMGLWSFTMQALGYFLLLDFGVTSSAGRLMAEPIHRADKEECSRWFSLFTVVLGLQGLVMLLAGYLLLNPILNWFPIPQELKAEARSLWLIMLLLNSLSFPMRVSAGILFAQNRYFWTTLTGSVGLWVGLFGFLLFLKGGCQSLAYGYSSALTMLFSLGLPWLAMKWGPQRFEFSWKAIRWDDLKELLNYSWAVFVIGLAVKVVFYSQNLVVTKAVGLGAVLLFNVSSRTGTLGLQLLWQSYDALSPRWQQLYVAGQREHLAASFLRYTGLTVSCALGGCALLFLINRPFVNHWMGPQLYAGGRFDLFLAFYMLLHTWDHCLAFGPSVAKDIRKLAMVCALETVLNIGLGFALARPLGVSGVLAGGLLGSAVTFIYLTRVGPRYLGLSLGQVIRHSMRPWLGMGLCAALAFAYSRWAGDGGENLWLRGTLCLLAGLVFAFLHRADLKDLLGRIRKPVGDDVRSL